MLRIPDSVLRYWRRVLPVVLAAIMGSECARAELSVHTDFPGGSGMVQSIDGEAGLIVLDPTDHPRRGWRCWWYVRIDGVNPAKPIHLEVGEAPWATPDRAHFSLDQETWRQTEAGRRQGKRIRYLLPPGNGESIWVAWGPPFVPEDAEALVEAISEASPAVTAFELCRTREGRATPALRVRESSTSEKALPLVWVQARQHAWESGSSWVVRGLVEWLISQDEAAVALRKQAEVVVVPIMDIDNVHRGAGGKNQEPQDHNRDWTDQPHWRAVAAAQKLLRAADEAARLTLFVDSHNPSARDRQPYFYVPPEAELSIRGRNNLSRFLQLTQEEMTGPLRFSGKVIESGATYDPAAWSAISKNWVTRNCRDGVVAVTLETAWNTPASTTSGYRTVGRQLGRAISRFVGESPRE